MSNRRTFLAGLVGGGAAAAAAKASDLVPDAKPKNDIFCRRPMKEAKWDPRLSVRNFFADPHSGGTWGLEFGLLAVARETYEGLLPESLRVTDKQVREALEADPGRRAKRLVTPRWVTDLYDHRPSEFGVVDPAANLFLVSPVSLPFATGPMNVYLRGPGKADALIGAVEGAVRHMVENHAGVSEPVVAVSKSGFMVDAFVFAHVLLPES